MTSLHQLTASTAGLPCRITDPNLWFSDNPTDRRYAARQCGSCPTLLACRLYSLETEQQWGVWGGVDMTAVETYCGSSRGYQIHRRNAETPCEACQTAHDEAVEAQRRRRLAEEHAKGGSVRGYWQHRHLGEKPCAECKRAVGRKSRERRERERAAAERARDAWDAPTPTEVLRGAQTAAHSFPLAS